MVSKATKRKVAEFWNHQCAICGNKDFLEYHHLTEKSKGGTDDYDNLILLCACCHATIHGRKYNPDKPNCRTSIDYETAIGKLFGAKTIYIEVFDRIDAPTIAGKLCYPVTDKFIVEWEEMKKVYPKAVNLGSIF